MAEVSCIGWKLAPRGSLLSLAGLLGCPAEEF